MSIRDPETGKFVSADESGELGPDAWWNMEHQHITINYEIDAGEGAEGSPGNLARQTYEPAGGLERGEVAELVYMDTSLVADIVPSDNLGTSPGRVRFDFEWIKDNPRANYSQVHNVSTVNVDDAAVSNDTEPQVEFRSNESLTDYSLLRGDAVVYQGFNDTVNGSGGHAGGDAKVDRDKNFRMTYGRGPLFMYDELFAIDAGIDLKQVDNERFITSWQTDFLWDIFEVDDPLKELKDIRPVQR